MSRNLLLLSVAIHHDISVVVHGTIHESLKAKQRQSRDDRSEKRLKLGHHVVNSLRVKEEKEKQDEQEEQNKESVQVEHFRRRFRAVSQCKLKKKQL